MKDCDEYMVNLYDEDEINKLEKNPLYLEASIHRLTNIMNSECIGDLERLPYKREIERLQKKLDILQFGISKG